MSELSRALNSAVECHLHTVEVIGSNPIAPTITYEFLTSSDAVPLPVQWVSGADGFFQNGALSFMHYGARR
jgi:hypothetical protein